MPLDFLDGEQSPDVTTPAENLDPAIEPILEPEAPVRGPDGKFAAKEPEEAAQVAAPPPEPARVAPPPPVSEPTVPPGHVPLAAMLDTRDKLKAAEALVEQMRQQIAQTQQPQTIPDPYEDPQGFQQFQAQQLQQAVLNTRLDLSEEMATSRHGNETVEAAKVWAFQKAQSSPFYGQEVLSSRNPYEKVVQDYKREQVLGGLSEADLAQFQAWKAAQAQAQPLIAQPSAGVPPIVAPPPSLVTAPSAGGIRAQPTGAGTAFDALPIP